MTMGFRTRKRQADCEHEHTDTVSAAGVERIACRACGHVSFSFVEGARRAAERKSFARQADLRPLEKARS